MTTATPSRTPKEKLLAAVVDVALAGGIADKSLRAIAAAAGTSHRMLIHHFGSREDLLVEVIRAVEGRQRAALSELAGEPGEVTGPMAASFWKHLRSPELAPQERLFFEVYGQALQGRPGTEGLLEGIVDDWLDTITDINVSMGMDPATARAHGRLGIAVTRGLLLDLLATRDHAAVDAAMDVWIDLNLR